MEPTVWGPLLWKLLHTMAEWSDRRDIIYRWKHVLELTSAAIPCTRCRRHMQEYLRMHSMFIRPPEPIPPVRGKQKGWIPAKGEDVKLAIRKGLWTFHNHVNRSTGATELTEEDANALYQGTDRATSLRSVRDTLASLEVLWRPRSEWIREVLALVVFLEAGTY